MELGEAPVINNSNTLRPALLISDKINKPCAFERVEGKICKPDTASQRRVDKCGGLDTRVIIQNTLDAEFKAAALVQLRVAVNRRDVRGSNGLLESDVRILELESVGPRPLYRLRGISRVKSRSTIYVELQTEPRRNRRIFSCANES